MFGGDDFSPLNFDNHASFDYTFATEAKLARPMQYRWINCLRGTIKNITPFSNILKKY